MNMSDGLPDANMTITYDRGAKGYLLGGFGRASGNLYPRSNGAPVASPSDSGSRPGDWAVFVSTVGITSDFFWVSGIDSHRYGPCLERRINN
jgi:hypothetical protein